MYADLEDGGYEGAVNHLLGFLNGISVDDCLCDDEIATLLAILERNNNLASKWPINALKSRLGIILADGIVDADERDDLLQLIKAISGQSLMETGLAYGLSADFSTTQNGKMLVTGKSICFTGKFLSGSRKIQESSAKMLGAKVKGNVSKGLDILVLGAVASKDWRFSSYGRKIEAALTYRSEGHQVEIINEELWNALILSK